LKVILGSKIPLRVTHYITYRCNLDCLYCSRHGSGGPELTTAEAKSLMAAFRKAGTLFWGFNGGETLMRGDIGELIDFGKRLGLFVSIATNGTLVARRRRDIRNADLVHISIEGPKMIHDGIRPLSYDSIREGIEVLNREGIRFTFTATINNKNLDSLGFILDLAERYRTKVVFQPIRIQKEDISTKSREFFPTGDRMRRAIDFLLLEKSKGRPIANSASYLREIKASWPDQLPDMQCWAGRLYCSLTPEGAATACCDTLALTRKMEAGRPLGKSVEGFYHLPEIRCSTCFASTPLEANLALSAFLKNPLSAVRQVASFLPWRYWRS